MQYTWEEQDDDDESDKKGGKDGDVWKQDKVWKKAAKYLQVSMIFSIVSMPLLYSAARCMCQMLPTSCRFGAQPFLCEPVISLAH